MCTELTSISARYLGHYRCIKSSKLEESICKDVYLGVCFCKGNFAVKYLLGNAKRHVTIKLRYRGLSLSVVSPKKKKKQKSIGGQRGYIILPIKISQTNIYFLK